MSLSCIFALNRRCYFLGLLGISGSVIANLTLGALSAFCDCRRNHFRTGLVDDESFGNESGFVNLGFLLFEFEYYFVVFDF